jgi:hypothetical protein
MGDFMTALRQSLSRICDIILSFLVCSVDQAIDVTVAAWLCSRERAIEKSRSVASAFGRRQGPRCAWATAASAEISFRVHVHQSVLARETTALDNEGNVLERPAIGIGNTLYRISN